MRGGWVYIMADRYRGATYIGVTADLATRIYAHRHGRGSSHVRKYGLLRLVHAEHYETIDEAIRREKAVKKWNRAWKFRLIEQDNPDWLDRYDQIVGT